MATAELQITGSNQVTHKRSLYRDAARRFMRNKLAVIGLVIVVVLTFFAFFADDWLIAFMLRREPESAAGEISLR